MEKEVEETPFGQITFNFNLKKGKVDLHSLNIVKNRRTRYTGN